MALNDVPDIVVTVKGNRSTVVSAPSGSATRLVELSDVLAAPKANGDILTYISANGRFEFHPAVGGGGGAGTDQFARDQANAAFTAANTANSVALSAFDQANTANTAASTSGVIALSALSKANAANVLAQAAYDAANTDDSGTSYAMSMGYGLP